MTRQEPCDMDGCIRGIGHDGEHRRGRWRTRTVRCAGCGRLALFTHPRRQKCETCSPPLVGFERAARNTYMRRYLQKYKRRRAAEAHRRIVLGPCRCQGCGESVTWNGYAWEEVTGARHQHEIAA